VPSPSLYKYQFPLEKNSDGGGTKRIKFNCRGSDDRKMGMGMQAVGRADGILILLPMAAVLAWKILRILMMWTVG
jgi:hypothetical protein